MRGLPSRTGADTDARAARRGPSGAPGLAGGAALARARPLGVACAAGPTYTPTSDRLAALGIVRLLRARLLKTARITHTMPWGADEPSTGSDYWSPLWLLALFILFIFVAHCLEMRRTLR